MAGRCGFRPCAIQRTHAEVNAIGGVCRHFSLCTVSKHLGLVKNAPKGDAPKGGGASGPSAPKRRKPTAETAAPLRLGKHGVIIISGEHKRLDALIESFRSRRVAIQKKINKADSEQSMPNLISAYEDLIFNPSVPHEMAWGRRSGVYHGEHLVRKLALIHYERPGSGWQWNSRADIMNFGPDKCEYMNTLPVRWKASRIVSEFWPVDPSRYSMWACLVGVALKTCPDVKEACAARRITKDMFAASAQELKAKLGHNPHVQDVLKHAISPLPAP